MRFSDPRRFGLMILTEVKILREHALIKNLGPEPLNPEFTGSALAARLKGCKTSIKSALLNQKIVAGLGNIYACESLFRSGISPKRRAGNVQGLRAVKLIQAIKSVLKEAVEAGGSSIRDHIQPNGNGTSARGSARKGRVDPLHHPLHQVPANLGQHYP